MVSLTPCRQGPVEVGEACLLSLTFPDPSQLEVLLVCRWPTSWAQLGLHSPKAFVVLCPTYTCRWAAAPAWVPWAGLPGHPPVPLLITGGGPAAAGSLDLGTQKGADTSGTWGGACPGQLSALSCIWKPLGRTMRAS